MDIENPQIFTSADVKRLCLIINDCNILDIYLSWRTTLMMKELYRHKLDPVNSIILQGLRHEYGIDCKKDIEAALAVYKEGVNKYFSAVAYCKYLTITAQYHPDKVQDNDTVLYELLRCITRCDEILAGSLWHQLCNKWEDFKPKVSKLAKIFLQKEPENMDKQLVKEQIYYLCSKINDEAYLRNIEPLALKKRYVLAAIQIIKVCSPTEEQPLTPYYKGLCETCIGMIRQVKFYQGYASIGKFLYALGRKEEADAIFRQGSSEGYWECNKLLLSIIKIEYKKMDYKELQRVLDKFVQTIICLGYRSEFYDYIYIYNLVKKKNKEWDHSKQDVMYKEVCRVAQKYHFHPDTDKEKSILILDIQHLIAVYFDEGLPLDERITRISNLYPTLTSPSNKRIAMFHIMKLNKKRLKVAQKLGLDNINDIREKLKKSQAEFIKFSCQTIDSKEFPTAIYRLGVCYEKGYGVAIDIGIAFLLYNKTIEQFQRKVNEPGVVFQMSFLNAFSMTQAKKRLEYISMKQEPQLMIGRITDKFNEEKLCPICLEFNSDSLLFPCMHIFCPRCLKNLLKPICPMCRGKIMVTLSMQTLNIKQ